MSKFWLSSKTSSTLSPISLPSHPFLSFFWPWENFSRIEPLFRQNLNFQSSASEAFFLLPSVFFYFLHSRFFPFHDEWERSDFSLCMVKLLFLREKWKSEIIVKGRRNRVDRFMGELGTGLGSGYSRNWPILLRISVNFPFFSFYRKFYENFLSETSKHFVSNELFTINFSLIY